MPPSVSRRDASTVSSLDQGRLSGERLTTDAASKRDSHGSAPPAGVRFVAAPGSTGEDNAQAASMPRGSGSVATGSGRTGSIGHHRRNQKGLYGEGTVTGAHASREQRRSAASSSSRVGRLAVGQGEEHGAVGTAEAKTTPDDAVVDSSVTNNNAALSNLNSMGVMGGMHGGGYGMMSPYGMMGYGIGSYGMMPPVLGGPLSGLNNFLFGFQSVVFSLGQAMQILGMNTQALHQLFNTAMSMLDSALAAINEMRALDSDLSDDELSEEEKKRRRRLRAIRWSMTLGITYAGYRMIHRWLVRRRQQFRSGPAVGTTAGYLGSSNGASSAYSGMGVHEWQRGYGRRHALGGGYGNYYSGMSGGGMDSYGGYGYGSSSPYGYGGMGGDRYISYGGHYAGY